MSKHTRTLHQAMPIVAAALGRKFGVSVAIGGAEAQTDGDSIQVPALPPDSALMPVAWGYLAHEAAHVRYTDFAAYRAGVAAGDALCASLQNILEDVRIERALAGPYPGTRETLQAVCAHLSAEGGMNAPAADAHPAQVLTSYLLLHLRDSVLGYDGLAAEAKQAEAVLRSVFPARTVHRLQGLLAEVDGLASTTDAVDLARRIRALLEAERQAAEQPQPSGDGDDATGAADGNRDQNEPAPRASGDHDSPAPCDDGQPAPAGNGHDDTTAVTDDRNDAKGKAQALARTLNATAADLPDDLFGQVRDLLESAGSGSSRCLLPRAESFDGDAQAGLRLLGVVQQESRRLRARLHGLVQASRLDRPQRANAVRG